MAFTPKGDGWKLYAIYYLNTRTEMWAPNEGVAIKWAEMRYSIAPGHGRIACRAFDITPQ